MLQAVIVDDEIPVLGLLKKYLEATGEVEVVGAYSDSAVGLDAIKNFKPDVVFLDIEMPEMNGLELAHKLLDIECEPNIVFVTCYNQFALEAFRVNAIDYVLKPVTPRAIKNCISKLQRFGGYNSERVTTHKQVQLNCFGEFEMQGEMGPINWSTRKIEELFAYFIVNRDSNVDAWQIGEALWPEKAPDKMKSNIHTTLFRLRKIIKESGLAIDIYSEKGGKGIYRCSFNNMNCDLFTFDCFVKNNATVESKNVKEAEKACEAYKGELFQNKYYEWCIELTAHYRQQYLRLLTDLASYYMQNEEYTLALEKLNRAAQLSPYDEVIHRNRLKVYYAQHNRAMLMKCHEEFTNTLIQEMGIYPQKETQRIYELLYKE